MGLPSRLAPSAQRHVQQILTHYRQQKPGLEMRFLSDLRALVGRISAYPEAFTPYRGRRRAVFTGKFPYVVVYRIRKSEVVITGIFHQKQKPRR